MHGGPSCLASLEGPTFPLDSSLFLLTLFFRCHNVFSFARVVCDLSNHDPLDLIERDLIVAPVIEAGGARALMVGHLLRDFELAAVAQVFGDAGGAEGVIADPGQDAGAAGAPAAPSLPCRSREVNDY
jgi:hypothetical protein